MLVLQAKLILEGMRDVVLGPIAIVAGVLGLLRRDGDPSEYFDRVLRSGYRFDDWINLYGPLGRLSPEKRAELLGEPPRSVDRYFERVEQVIVEQYEKGGVTRSAKQRIDALLNTARPKDRQRKDRP